MLTLQNQKLSLQTFEIYWTWELISSEILVHRNYKWIIMAAHYPQYCSNHFYCHSSTATRLRESIEPLLKKYKVDIFFAYVPHTQQKILEQRQERNNGLTLFCFEEVMFMRMNQHFQCTKNKWSVIIIIMSRLQFISHREVPDVLKNLKVVVVNGIVLFQNGPKFGMFEWKNQFKWLCLNLLDFFNFHCVNQHISFLSFELKLKSNIHSFVFEEKHVTDSDFLQSPTLHFIGNFLNGAHPLLLMSSPSQNEHDHLFTHCQHVENNHFSLSWRNLCLWS